MEISFEFLQSLGEGKRVSFYDILPNDHVRFIAPYKGSFYLIFWLGISVDGAICCGVRDMNATSYASGTMENKGEVHTLDLNQISEMTEVENPDRLRKMTFHSSGIIHGAEYGKPTYRKSLYELSEQEELLLVLFKEPNQYQEITGQARKKDICILSDIPERCPVFLRMYIAPKDRYKDVTINQGVSQYNAVLLCNEIPGVGDIVIQLCFNFLDNSEYPPRSIMIWPTVSRSKDACPENGSTNGAETP